jgi:hypothetical protein
MGYAQLFVCVILKFLFVNYNFLTTCFQLVLRLIIHENIHHFSPCIIVV